MLACQRLNRRSISKTTEPLEALVRLDWCPVAREIVVISEAGNPKLDSDEVFEEIVSFLRCYSMKLFETKKEGRGRTDKRLKLKMRPSLVLDVVIMFVV
jgi:hypothetical protein